MQHLCMFVVLACALSAVAQDPLDRPVALRQQWQEGHRYTQRISMQMDQEVRVPDAEAPVLQQMKQIQTSVLDVEKSAADGSHFGSVAITEVKTRIGMGAAKVEFDSSKPATEDAGDPMSLIMRSLIGAPIGYEIGAAGVVNKIAIPEPREKTPQTEAVGQQLESIFSQLLTQMTMRGLPASPVETGATWPENRTAPLANLGEMALSGTWKFDKFVKRDGFDCAILTFSGKLKVKPDLTPDSRLRILTAKGNVIGTVWFDVDAGAVVRSQMAQDVKVRMIRADDKITADGSNEIATNLRQMVILELLSLQKR